ncbi:hypothetical protein CLAIMM_03127 isoform 3 [Cladophialophora immunda]|nr:hypothetical protein CLAIMM_03127 isoform 1 [Cladophialophora immunda]OQU97150.1 hypothetical protein CLAIMM_03127 isoform 3 [Cladophialophora immunda]
MTLLLANGPAHLFITPRTHHPDTLTLPSLRTPKIFMANGQSTSTRPPQVSILEDGVFCVEDAVIGKRVKEIEEKGFPFKTLDGLEFCKLHTFDDEASIKSTWKGYI